MNSIVEHSGRRVALVINALTKGELTGGNRDIAAIYSLLTNPNVGACSHKSPAPIHECNGYSQFRDALFSATNDWQLADQLVFYFSGHGIVQRGVYCLKVGPSDHDYYPFSALSTDLTMRGIRRAILILDTCHSGMAVEGQKSDDSVNNVLEKSIANPELPEGIAIVASCRSFETSRELQDGSMSVFTHLLCQGLESGLDNTPTHDGLITVEHIVNYIGRKLKDPDFQQFEQAPKFKLDNADSPIWLAKNRSGIIYNHTIGEGVNTTPISDKELELLYNRTQFMESPCADCEIEELDWDLIREYCKKAHSELLDSFDKASKEQILRNIKFYSSIPFHGKQKLRNSVVLCFAKRPDHFFPQAISVFVVGHPGDDEIIKEDIVGPLSRQVDQLIEKVSQRLNTISTFDQNSKRIEIKEIDIRLLREIIVNAIMHRDYEFSSCVTVILLATQLEIKSPGLFPKSLTWENFLNLEVPDSRPRYPAIRYYLNNLLQAEGIGRGFSLIKKYLNQNGNDSISFNIEQTEIVRISISRSLKSNYLFNSNNPIFNDEVTAVSISLFGRAFGQPVVDIVNGKIQTTREESRENQRWITAAEAYRAHLIRHYGAVRVIDATEDTLLDDLFTDLYVLDNLTTHRREQIEELQEIDPDSFRTYSTRKKREHGITLIKNNSYEKSLTNFYILGKPGAGKTAFLKYITIQCARHQAINRIPIFVSLHEWARQGDVSLFNFIVSRFDVCKFPDAAGFIKRLLQEGKAILLFDGLDEVRSEGNQRDLLTDQLRDFVQKYDLNQHLITCRIAASDYIFPRFKTVEVADFTPEQIESYGRKWFHGNPEIGKQFIEELKKPAHKGVYELCNTPLLLSMVCFAFDHARAFPLTRAELYEDALDVLLRRWDTSRNIQRDAIHPDENIYREFSPKRKKDMFARIAARTFEKGEYFFRRRDLERWIADYLATLPNIKSADEVDGQIVLKAIEAQHSIFVERAKDIYSFSHLAIQEFFTAMYTVQYQNRGLMLHQLSNYLDDPRWHEVFLLISDLMSVDDSFATNLTKLVNKMNTSACVFFTLISWANERSSRDAHKNEQNIGIRFAYLLLAITPTIFELFSDTLSISYRYQDDLILRLRNKVDKLRHIVTKIAKIAGIFGVNIDSSFASNILAALDSDLDISRSEMSWAMKHWDNDVDGVYFEPYDSIKSTYPSTVPEGYKQASQLMVDYCVYNAWICSAMIPKVDSLKYCFEDERLKGFEAYNKLIETLSQLAEINGLSELTVDLIELPKLDKMISGQSWDRERSWDRHLDILKDVVKKRGLLYEQNISEDQLDALVLYLELVEQLVQSLKGVVISDQSATLDRLLAPPKAT